MDLQREACCPFVYTELSTSKVMTMERFRGAPLTDLEAISKASPGNNAEATLISALNTWFGSVMACETFHADVHAGNLLVGHRHTLVIIIRIRRR
jgi:aarF domain-containing kinase